MDSKSFRFKKCGMSAAIILATGAVGSVSAQPAESSGPAIEEVVVTGTLLRGQAPVGSPITTVGREEIDSTNAATTQDILRMIPNTSNSGAVAQGSLVGSSYFAPTIRSLGSSASTSTLVLIDSHRIPLGGLQHPLPDPSIVPTIAIERVEVIADGSSSVYGSDAVAGVVNFITRDSYDGLMLTAQGGFGDQYDTQDLGALWGTNWIDGSVMAAYNYSNKSNLPWSARRDILDRDQRPRGGSNFLNNQCEPATIQPAGHGVYRSVNATSPLPDANVCQDEVSDHIGDQVRHNLMLKLQQDISESLTARGDLVYSHRQNSSQQSRGTIQATAFATGPQANPFYENPPGVDAGSQTLRLRADELFGLRPETVDTGEVMYGSGELQWSINENFTLTGFAMYGTHMSDSVQLGGICGSCAYLALNGTAQSNGDPNAPAIIGTNITPTNLPLTANNALDLWRPAASNRTNPDVLSQIVDTYSLSKTYQTIEQYRVILDGDIFELPTGTVRAAVGAELVRYEVNPERIRSNNIGVPNSAEVFAGQRIEQDVESLFAEILIPIVGSAQGIPGINSFDLNMSIRRDEYPLFGATTNPKVGFDWEVREGLKLRASFSESFVAPPMSTTADQFVFSQYGQSGGQLNIPIQFFPEAQLLPGCENETEFCTVGSGTDIRGMRRLGTDPGMDPQTGRSWSAGFDFAPVTIPGRISVTYFANRFRGGITSGNNNMIVNAPGEHHKLIIFPEGATQEQINELSGGNPLASELPDTVYYFANNDMANVVNLDISGWDVQGDYSIPTDNIGMFRVGGSVTYFDSYDQFFGQGGEVFSVLGTQGFNQTFSSVKMQARADLGWELDNLRARMFAHYTPSHKNWSNNAVTPIGLSAGGSPDGTGGDHVDSFLTFDLNLSYELTNVNMLDGALSDSQVYLDVNNLLDEEPPFYNSPDGYGPYNANPIGRVISAGVRFRF